MEGGGRAASETLRKSQVSVGSSARPRRSITVLANSESHCEPDVFSLAVSVCSTKDSAEAAQSSVKRRTDYILQVLRNSGIREKRVEQSTHVSRERDGEVSVKENLLARAGSLHACEAARNVIVSKMDSSVDCGEIQARISPAHRAETRHRVFEQAVLNAREKATSVARLLDVRLGPALEVEEVVNNDQQIIGASPIPHSATAVDFSQGTLSPHSLTEQWNSCTETFSAVVRVTFEAAPVRNCHHNSCRKHH